MSEHRNDNLGVSFRVSEPITVRAHLRYLSDTSGSNSFLERLWIGAVNLIQDWQCAQFPDLKKIDLDANSTAELMRVILWVGGEVWRVMQDVSIIPKD